MDSVALSLRSGAIALSKPGWPALDRLLQPVAIGTQSLSRGLYQETGHLLDDGGRHCRKKGRPARATPNTILDFCGEEIHWRNPGYTVDAFFKGLDRLAEIGVISDADITEPPSRIKGYFKEWLEIPITVTLSDKIWSIREKSTGISHHGQKSPKEQDRPQITAVPMPRCAGDLIDNPRLIRQFRTDYYLHQDELAHTLDISRQTLSSYERGLRILPEDKAIKILQIWQRKAKAD